MFKVLIIEDNENLAIIIRHYLLNKGLEADIASDGGVALDAFSRTAYDLLLVDVRLPVMNGDEVCRRIRIGTSDRDIPIILMSGVIQDPDEIEKLKRELHVGTFLTKPFHSETLYMQIMTTLQALPAAVPLPAAKPGLVASPQPATAQQPPVTNIETLPPAIKGDLEKIPFEQILLYLMLKRGTGFLTVDRGPAKRQFSFIDGAAVELEIPPADDDFGHYLASRNLINTAELREYEAQRIEGGTDPRDLFIKMGCLTPHRFQDENRNFLHDRLIECFSWRTGTVLFTWGPTIVKTIPAAGAFTPSLFYQGFRNHLPHDRLNAFLKEKGALYVSKTAALFEYQNHLADDLPGSTLFDLINGEWTCSGIVSTFDTDDAAVVLYTLDYLKLLSYSTTPKRSDLTPPFPMRERKQRQLEREAETFEDLGGELSELAEEIEHLEILSEPKTAAVDEGGLTDLEEQLRNQWETIKNKNYYEMLGMTAKTFSIEKLKKAYFELARTYGPEKFFASSGEIMELAEEFLSSISNAYTTLSDVVAKENYDEILASKVPTGEEEKKFFEKVQYQSGMVLLEKGQYDSAEKTFTTCVNLNPDKPEYQVYLAVAMYHNPANKGNASANKKAKDLVNRALQWEKLAIAYALKGQMLLDEGLVNLAESEFNKALRLNPKNQTSIKNLEFIKQKWEEEEKKGGLFQRMFK
jgi:CheY-like chemotaxis protein/curved DNA-binding protein CbpA